MYVWILSFIFKSHFITKIYGTLNTNNKTEIRI